MNLVRATRKGINMELTIALALSILSGVMTVVNFAVNRKDKAVKDAKETNAGLIDYRLNELDRKIQRILDKLEDYDKDIKKCVDEAMEHHIREYHKEGK